MLYFKYVYVVIKAIVCVSDTLFTCLHWLRKERFRWFSEVRIPRALVLHMLWRRVKTEMIPSWWFSTSLVEKARCLNHYLYKAPISILNAENLSTPAEKHQMLAFSKNLFTPSMGIKFPTTGLSEMSFCCLPSSLLYSFAGVFNVSEAQSSHLTGDTLRVHTVL